MKDWIKELCPEIADWQAELIAEHAQEYVARKSSEEYWMGYNDGRLAERELCAKLAEETVCDTHIPTGVKIYGSRAAAAIRARSNT